MRRYDEAADDGAERAVRVAIAAGGTAGHVAPALAVAGCLRERGVTVSFIGGTRAEAEMVPAAGFELHTLAVQGLSRSNPVRAVRAALGAGVAMVRARILLRALGAHAVLGAGGYVSGPVGAAALSLGLPLVLTEADSRLGLANRLLAPRAHRVCLAFPIAGREGGRYRVTGRPVPFRGGDRAHARARFGVPAQRACIVVFGGSLGARSINRAALRGLADGDWHVLHIAGRRDYRALADALAREGPRTGYDLHEYLSLEELAWALSAADLVVARAGGSVLEIALHGVPAILVPYPGAAGDHQLHNARFVEAAGAAVVVPDAELGPERLRGEVAGLLGDARRMAKMAAGARALARPRAAEDVADELLGTLKE